MNLLPFIRLFHCQNLALYGRNQLCCVCYVHVCMLVNYVLVIAHMFSYFWGIVMPYSEACLIRALCDKVTFSSGKFSLMYMIFLMQSPS